MSMKAAATCRAIRTSIRNITTVQKGVESIVDAMDADNQITMGRQVVVQRLSQDLGGKIEILKRLADDIGCT